MITLTDKERTKRIELAFNQFNGKNNEVLKSFYHPDIHFVDPIGEIRSLDKLSAYYHQMYMNLTSIQFEFRDSLHTGTSSFVTWKMTFSTKSLNQGRDIVVEGGSYLIFDASSDLVIYHRDYLDLGSMVYEHIPVIGKIIKIIRSRLTHN